MPERVLSGAAAHPRKQAPGQHHVDVEMGRRLDNVATSVSVLPGACYNDHFASMNATL